MTARKSYRKEMSLELGGESLRLEISAMKRKSLRLHMKDDGVVDLRIPLGCPQHEVLAFVRRHENWLLERLRVLSERQSRLQTAIMVRGRQLPLQESALDEFLVTDQQIWVPSSWTASQRQKAIDDWLRTQARTEYQRMIERWWPQFAQYSSQRPLLRIKKMKTRWGSLSQRGYINLNLALMQLPQELMELVVVHELCHLKHFDHGPGFRALMTQCLPDWRQREQALKQMASYL